VQAIHKLGVLQMDPRAPNILIHPDRPVITWIDFERAELSLPRVALGSLSANRRRKSDSHKGANVPTQSDEECAQKCTEEIVAARKKLGPYVGSTSFI
jgi:hypothetical protein